MLIKKFILGLINKVFGLNISLDQFDAFMNFISMLIEVFGSATEAASFVKRTTVKSYAAGHVRAKQVLSGMEQTLGEK